MDALGPTEIGVILNTYLFGLLTVQAYTFFEQSKNTWKLKTFVGMIWVLNLVHTILCCHTLYNQTISAFLAEVEPNSPREFAMPSSLTASVLMAALITPPIQIYLAERVRRLSKHWVIPVICWVLVTVRFGGLIYRSVRLFRHPYLSEFYEMRILMIVSWSMSAAVDILIAGSLCYYLCLLKKEGYPMTQRMVDKVILWTLQTGLLTCLSSILMLSFFVGLRNDAYLVLFLIVPKLFSNSLLANLNSHSSYTNPLGPTVIDFADVRPGTLQIAQQSLVLSSKSNSQPLTIEMTITREVSDEGQSHSLSIADISAEDVATKPIALEKVESSV